MTAAIIPHYHVARRGNLSSIVEALDDSKQFDEVIIFNNHEDDLYIPGVTVINSGRNFGSIARYGIAVVSEHQRFLFQDDDLIIPPTSVQILMSELDANLDSIVGILGMQLGEARPYLDRLSIDGRKAGKTEVDVLLGRVKCLSMETLIRGLELMSRINFKLCRNQEDIPLGIANKSKGNKNFVVNAPFIELDHGTEGLSYMSNHFTDRDLLAKACLEEVRK